MAKKKTPKMNQTTDYEQIQRNIQKAKGNPNKNIHHKKNNSNYGGYNSAAKKAEQQKMEEQHEKMPLWMKITLGVMLVALLVMVFLLNGPLKENILASHITSIISGASCLVVYYSQRWSPRSQSTFMKILGFVLILLGIIFIATGCYGVYLTLTA